jgi:eukaryotic-like serine/threonine-protein kinase
MALTTGTKLGPYEVVSPLGAGGMGQVYRARDSRLGRDVAIKALAASATDDPDLSARFEREGRVLASLNHPHIASLYGVEESAGALFLVMELVEGGTLAARIAQGPLPLRDALTIASQIADALAAAHDKGIIHRDLKPANVALASGIHVKVLDFGLAKAAKADAEAITERLSGTAAGIVLGTAAYMSPEQARGLPVDKRSDIWSFGCVLFELLTGRHPFRAATVSDTIAAILHRDPDWTLLPEAAPPRVRWLVQRLLEKDQRRRLHDIADARIELEEAIAELSGSRAPIASAQPRGAARWPMFAGWLVASAVTAALIWTMTADRGESASTTPKRGVAAAIVLPPDIQLSLANPAGRFAISPDGTTLVVVAADQTGRNMLWLRTLDSAVARPLAGTEDAAFPFWSPDSRFVAFLASDKLKKVAVAGGAPLTLADATLQNTGTWSRDDVILFAPKGSSVIHRVSAAGGTSAPVTTLDTAAGDVQHWYPSFLPDGRRFVYFVVGSKAGGLTDPRAIQVASLDPSEKPRTLIEGGSNARFANGYLVYLRQGTLVAHRFDPQSLTFPADPVPLVEQVQIAGAGTTGVAGAFSVSDAGVLVYQAGFTVKSQLTWLDRSGQPAKPLGDIADYADVALSPDATRAAVSVLDPALGTRDIWIYYVERGHRVRFTSDPGDDFAPVWAGQDGGSIVFSSRRGANIHLYMRATRGNAPEQLLYEDPLGKFAGHVSHDARHLIYVGGGGIIRRSDLWILPLTGDRKARPWLETPFVETQAQFSPDDRWVAHTSYESGRAEVYVRRFADAGGSVQVSTAGGSYPRWSKTGDRLVFVAPDGVLMSVPVTSKGDELEIGAARRMFAVKLRRNSRLDAYQYDIAPDGRILVNGQLETLESTPITLLWDWPRLIER